jgi:hypothetical protein
LFLQRAIQISRAVVHEQSEPICGKGVRGVLNSFRTTALKYLRLFFAVSLLAPSFNSDATLHHAKAPYLSPSQSVLLQTLQTKPAVVRSLRLQQTDGHPVDVHPAVESVGIRPGYVAVARFPLGGPLNPESRKVGWQARAPPVTVMLAMI